MLKAFFFVMASAFLVGGPAQVPAPAAEVQALTIRLNQLMRTPHSEEKTDVLVSLADCGVRQTIRKYRRPEKPSSTNIAVSNTKKGGSWSVKSNDTVELELAFSLAWSEVGSVTYAPQQSEESGPYFDVVVRRHAGPKGKSSGLADSISLSLFTNDEKEVAALVKKLDSVRLQCTGKKG